MQGHFIWLICLVRIFNFARCNCCLGFSSAADRNATAGLMGNANAVTEQMTVIGGYYAAQSIIN